MGLNDVDEMANSTDPDQTAILIWVCTVCPGLSVRKLRKITVSTIQTEYFIKTPDTTIIIPTPHHYTYFVQYDWLEKKFEPQ